MADRFLEAEWPAPAGIVAGTTLRGADDVDLPGEPLWLQQVHGDVVVEAGSPAFAAGPPRADASIARGAGSVCVVRTADCLPVLLCARDAAEIAAVHAGWRGLAAGILERTLERMQAAAGDVLAWLGPAISQPNFEVGEEVRVAFGEWGERTDTLFLRNARGRWQADLYGIARARLRAAGVESVHGGGHCTYADAERFYSYRRDGETGRMLSYICRRP